jgi:hypothetical protein
MTDRYIRDGQVAVLVSPGFGAGWSTWCESDDRKAVTFDPWIVDILLSDQYNRKEKIDRIYAHCAVKYPDMYMGGVSDLTVEWIPQGTLFRITEYDGSETIELKEAEDWIQA